VIGSVSATVDRRRETTMARAIWSGAVSFGLVTIPVKAFAAVRDHSIHFNQLDAGSGARIKYKKVSEKTGREVDADHIEKGYEVSKGNYVVVDPDELAELTPRSTRTIDVGDFVALEEIDPIYYDHTYWLAPDGEAADRPYRLLLATMEERQRVGIGTVVMRNKQYLGAVRPLDGALALSTMRFADEVVPKTDIDGLPSRRAKPDAKELKLASQIVDSLASDWKPEQYRDTYTDELKDLIARKAKGEELVVEPGEEEAGAEVIDLMAALEASIADAKGGRSRSGSGTKRATSKAKGRPKKAASSRRKASSSKAGTKGATKASAKRKSA
jgi:DNA end-binding protein Ku